MTSFAATRAGRTATPSLSSARSAQWLGRPFAATRDSAARSFRSFRAAADLQRGVEEQALTMLMFGRS